MKKVVLVFAASAIAVLLSMPVYGWDEDCYGDYNDGYYHHRYYPRHYRRRRYGDGYGRRYYDPYSYGYGGYHDYGYHEYYERHFGDRPLRFRFRSPDFDLDIQG